MKQKGFTLVELLAVIAIIAIIATITTPIILDVLTDSRANAFKDNAMALDRAAQNYYSGTYISNNVKLPLLVTFNQNKETNKYIDNKTNTCETTNDRIIEYGGETPDSGNIFIDKNGDIYMAIYNEEISTCATKNPEDKTVTMEKTDAENCVLNNDPCSN